ncbi:MAG TPA: phosphatase PAP2 family protein [Gemmataceae bacterium]|jgi:undecaprenyl-diphosphatase
MSAAAPAQPHRPRLHRRWVLMFVFGAAAFALLAAGVACSDPLVHLDQTVAAGLHRHAERSPGAVRVAEAITLLGTFYWFTALAVVVVGGFWRAGRLRLGLAWLLVLIGGGLWVDGLKNTFDRQRPPCNQAFITELSYSFPSGHAAGSAVAYGTLAYCLALHWRTRRQRVVLVVGFGALVLLIGFTRLYLCVHYLSDVLGGYALALSWVGLCVYAIEWARSRFSRGPGRPSSPAAGPSP